MQILNSPPAEPGELPELRALSSRIGKDLSLVQGSGGNTSIKNGDVLWVKASGTWLSDAEDRNILVPVDLPMVNSILNSGGSDFTTATLSGDLWPSIETSLHCQLPHHVVVHVHSVSGIAWTVQKDARNQLEEILDGLSWRYIPYAKPGVDLTAAVFEGLAGSSEIPDLLVLENHGLVLGGDSCDSVRALLREVERKLSLEQRVTPEPRIDLLEDAIEEHSGWELPKTTDIHRIALDDSALRVSIGGALIPDHAVFLEKPVPISESADEITNSLAEYRDRFDYDPDWMIVRDAGVVLSNRLGAAGEAQLRGLSEVVLRIPPGSEVRYIDEEAANDLRDWDAEIYRKKLDSERS